MELSGHRSQLQSWKSTSLLIMPIERLLYLWDWVLPRIPSDVSYQIVPDQIFKMALCTMRGDTFMSVPYSLTELRDRLLKSLPRTYSPLSLLSSEATSLRQCQLQQHPQCQWSPSCGMRDLKKECHPLIYQSPLVSSHSSSSLG